MRRVVARNGARHARNVTTDPEAQLSGLVEHCLRRPRIAPVRDIALCDSHKAAARVRAVENFAALFV